MSATRSIAIPRTPSPTSPPTIPRTAQLPPGSREALAAIPQATTPATTSAITSAITYPISPPPGGRDAIAALAATVNRRFDAPVVRVGAAPTEWASVTTGFAALDVATGLGGFPRGRITELIGRPTSGRETIAARTAARVSLSGFAAWIDVSGALDVAHLAECGADLDRLFILRPPRPLDALAIADRLIAAGRYGVVVLDALPDLDGDAVVGVGTRGNIDGAVERFLRIVTPRLSRSETALVVLAAPEHPHRALAHAAALRIALLKVGFLRRGGVFRGWRTRAQVLKSPGLQGGESGLEVWVG